MKTDFHNIEFSPRSRSITPASALMGVLAVVALISLIVYAARKQQEVAETRETLKSLSAGATAGNQLGISNTLPDTQVKGINTAIKSLNFSWDKMLVVISTALQPAFPEQRSAVSLLALEPDLRTDVLHLVAESRSFSAMLEFQHLLSAQETVAMAALSKHEVVIDHPQHPVRFWMDVQLKPEGDEHE